MLVEIPTLTTDRLDLQPPTADAAAVYEAFYTDAEASENCGGPLTSGQTWARLTHDLGA